MTQATAHIPNSKFTELASGLAATAKALHARGWLSGTSGNLSAVVQKEPLLLAMSSSGVDKGNSLLNRFFWLTNRLALSIVVINRLTKHCYTSKL